MNIQLPSIDLNGLLPVIGLVLVVVLIGLFLIVRSILNSKIALLIAVVIGVAAAGPTLANAAAAIVGALVPLGVLLVVGGVTLVWLLQRNPELMSLVRDVVPRKSAPTQPPPLEQGRGTVVIDQLPAQRQTVKRTVSRSGTDDWGLR